MTTPLQHMTIMPDAVLERDLDCVIGATNKAHEQYVAKAYRRERKKTPKWNATVRYNDKNKLYENDGHNTHKQLPKGWQDPQLVANTLGEALAAEPSKGRAQLLRETVERLSGASELVERSCQKCGRTFIPSRTDELYCSKRCRS